MFFFYVKLKECKNCKKALNRAKTLKIHAKPQFKKTFSQNYQITRQRIDKTALFF